MKYLLIIILLTTNLFATNYYVKNDGNDKADGLSDATAWKTITKINSMSFLSGDEILFKRGEIWKGKLIPPSSGVEGNPITIGAYGEGNKPIIDGQAIASTSLTWVNRGNGVYVASAFSVTNKGISTIFNVTEDGIPLMKMKENDDGANTDITGLGEWAWNGTTDSIFIRTKRDNDPSTADIYMSIFTATITCIQGSDPNYVVYDNLDIRGSYYNIHLAYSHGSKIQNCNFAGAYGDAIKLAGDYVADHDNPIHILGAKNILIQNNDISYFGESGIDNTGGENITINGNSIHHSVSDRGYMTPNCNVNGIMCKNYAVNPVVEYNHIYNLDNTRYGAIVFGGGGTSPNDGSSKETYDGIIRYNLINNVSALPFTTNPSYIIGMVGTVNSEIYNNTITDCVIEDSNFCNGIIVFDLSNPAHPDWDNENPIIKNNIFYNNIIESGFLITESSNGDVEGLKLSNNIYADKYTIKYVGKVYSSYQDWEVDLNDSCSKVDNPELSIDYTPKKGSPAIDAGVNVDVTHDIVGNPIIGKPDIGAYEHPCILGNIKVYLEGAYKNGTMTTNLSNNNLVPKLQPYRNVPWNYEGTESVSAIPPNIVDWILVELRSGITSNTIIAKRAGFLKSNGSIVDLDGNSPLIFDFLPAGKYYIVVQHRNHLSVMSSNPVMISDSSSLYDFTTSQSKAYGINPMVNSGNNIYGMYAGDGNANGGVSSKDRNNVWQSENGKTGYLQGDYNLDGLVNNDDLNLFWVKSNGNLSQVPK